MTSTVGKAPAKVRATRLKIEKFRAIRYAEIELGEATALVGQNGSGKSSVLRALNAFFHFDAERADFESGNHAYAKNTQAVIEVTLEGLQPDPVLPGTETGDGTLRAKLKYKKQAIWQCYSGGSWVQAPPGFREALSRQVSYALIPTRRDHAVAHDPADGLLERAVGDWVTNGRQRDRVSPQIVKLGEQLQKNSLAGFEKQLRKIAPLDGPFSFELKYAMQPDYKLLLANLELTVNEGGQPIPLADSGSGTQSMAIFALYAYLAELQSKSFILGLEEPEQNLHPQAQQQLMRNLVQLGLQVLFTTHSPTVVDSLDHENVILCRRIKGRTRGLEAQITQISRDFFTRNGLDREGYYKFHQRKNSEFMFADLVVVVESPIDAAALAELLGDAGSHPNDSGISIVSLDGVEAIEHMYHLLKELDIESAYVVDKDYFLPYRVNNERKLSLDARGYPQYGSSPKKGSLLQTMFPEQIDRDRLVSQLLGNHSDAMATLREVGFFCFRYSLEVDLVAAEEPRNRLHEYLKVPEAQRSESELLVNRQKRIKQQDAVIMALSGLPARSLPNSYKSLRRELPRLAAAARVRL